jgi:hypothetical protein
MVNVKWVVGGAVGALLIGNGVLFHRVGTLETDLSKQRAAEQSQLAEIQQAAASSEAAVKSNLEQISTQMDDGAKSIHDAAMKAAAKARTDAQKSAEKLVAEAKEQQQAADERVTEQFNKEIGAVREEQNTKVTGIETNLGNVQQTVGTIQQEAASQRTTLDQTLADLKSVRGDLGVHSGLIATNGKELAALRELGERNYFEFTIEKNKPTSIANLSLELKKVDTKHNKYNLSVMADDKRIEKKDKTVNEPVQMYVGGARQPYEIVVNEVKKDKIVGYVSVPKVTLRAAR